MSKRALAPAPPSAPDLVRDGLRMLQQRVMQAAIERRDLSDIQLQQDTVEGARRLCVALAQIEPATADTGAAWCAARAYLGAAEDVLARLEVRAAQPLRRMLERGR